MTPHGVLKRYWGYQDFRPKQLDIINRVLAGKDTIALLTTGGGKSVCFQVPALISEGLTIVISPLIALMKDQVDSLKSKGIAAEAIYSGMNYRTIDRLLDNAVYGAIKILYLSPERLMSDLVVERIKKMKVSLFAVDEAHCISQWGYDFRPAYLKISSIREWHPETPVLALTATATQRVIEDITDKLEMKDVQAYKTSFQRPELAINMSEVDTKETAILDLLKNTTTSTIVYAYSRRNTKDYSDHLNRNGLQTDFYHAGLSQEVRQQKQKAWMSGSIPIMVCTNAFGMGIDKANVRHVIHLHIPASIEAYYQEIGRAGRDGKAAKATLLFAHGDAKNIQERVERSFPTIPTIRRIYEAIGGYLDLAVGGGLYESYDFDLMDFAKKFEFDLLEVHHTIQMLNREGYLTLSEQRWQSASAWIKLSSSQTVRYTETQPNQGTVLRSMLRLYQHIGQQHTFINEAAIARHAQLDTRKTISILNYLHKTEIIDYIPRKEMPQLTFNTARLAAQNLSIDHQAYHRQKQLKLDAVKAMIQLVNHTGCRQQHILQYFGESEVPRCRICDRCTSGSEAELNSEEWMKSFNQLAKDAVISEDLMTNNTIINYLLQEGKIIQKGKSMRKT